MAMIVTNDSDLVEPIKVARQVLGKQVYQLIPCRASKARANKELMRAANYHKVVGEADLAQCLFADMVQGNLGTVIRKPGSW